MDTMITSPRYKIKLSPAVELRRKIMRLPYEMAPLRQ